MALKPTGALSRRLYAIFKLLLEECFLKFRPTGNTIREERASVRPSVLQETSNAANIKHCGKDGLSR